VIVARLKNGLGFEHIAAGRNRDLYDTAHDQNTGSPSAWDTLNTRRSADGL
jgi:hypothetical protein